MGVGSIFRNMRVGRKIQSIGGGEMIYKSYDIEPNIERVFTDAELMQLYVDEIDKTEYQDFDVWMHDMLKMQILIEVEK